MLNSNCFLFPMFFTLNAIFCWSKPFTHPEHQLRHYYTMTKATVDNPVVLGSEGSGTIEAIPEGETSFQVGQKAAGGLANAINSCPFCWFLEGVWWWCFFFSIETWDLSPLFWGGKLKDLKVERLFWFLFFQYCFRSVHRKQQTLVKVGVAFCFSWSNV